MDTMRICQSCRKPLPADVPLGLCPECLIKAGFPTDPGAGSRTVAEIAANFQPPSLAEMAGFFPQLEILEFVGKGGMGAVYKARQRQLDRIVALKILPPGIGADAGFAERFAREARALAKLNHPAIVTLFEFGQASGLYFFLMEFVDGMNIRQLLARGRISSREALGIVPQICDALQFAHDQGIVHRDIKPENILVDRRGRVKLADFGLAKLLGSPNETAIGAGTPGSRSNLTEVGKVMGTPNYMAPEQLDSPEEVDNRADIYALGVVFYQMLTGELPGKPLEPPSRKVSVDVRLDEVVLRAMERKPELRYQQASELKTRVETIAGTAAGGGAVPPGAPPPFSNAAITPRGDMVTAPAIALIVAGTWKIFSALIAVLVFFLPVSWLGSSLADSGLFSGFHLTGLILASAIFFKAVPGVLIIYGAIQMIKLRSHPWAMAAAVLAVLSIVNCSILGVVAGIWALIVLSRPEVRAAFNPDSPRPAPGRTSGKVWIIVGVILLLVLAGIGAVVIGVVSAVSHFKGMNPANDSARGKVYQNINLTLPLNPHGSFRLDNVNGQITITGWDRNEVAVIGVKHGDNQKELDDLKAEVESDTNHMVIHTRQASGLGGSYWSWPWFGTDDSGKVDYTVQVPAGAVLEKIESVNGNVTIAGVSGDITVSSINGSAKVSDSAGNLKVSTTNGRITAEFARLGAGQSVSLETINGALDLTLPDAADATVSASTVNGGISSDFSSLEAKKEFMGSDLKGTLGGGGASVKASTVNGAIHFAKAGSGASGN